MTLTDPKTSNISVIIPTLNEEIHIARTIQSAQNEALEIIVVDSGSDATAKIARQLKCKVITTNTDGRAAQMNAGVKVAIGDILLFLHGDTLLPEEYSAQINTLLNQPKIICGAFKLRINQPGMIVRLIEFCSNIRAQICGWPYGDQAIFMYKSQFDSINGYEDVPFLEDVLLIKTLKNYGEIAITASQVITSGRRWHKHGIIKTTMVNRLVMLGFLFGVSPKRLQNWYRIGKK